jgi:hypothetical protein
MTAVGFVINPRTTGTASQRLYYLGENPGRLRTSALFCPIQLNWTNTRSAGLCHVAQAIPRDRHAGVQEFCQQNRDSFPVVRFALDPAHEAS